MNELEKALALARVLWGPYADVREENGSFVVGHHGGLGHGLTFNVKGTGKSWAEAFADAGIETNPARAFAVNWHGM